MGLIKKYREWREYEQKAQTLEEVLLQAGIGSETVTKEQALNIPSVSGCVDIISSTIAMLPIELFQDVDGKVNTVKGDNRVKLLNDDTRDTLDAFQFKKQLIEDYLLSGSGRAYIKKDKNEVSSLHYVDHASVGINKNSDPIFKSYNILINGKTYQPFEFIQILRKTKDGCTGKGIISENNDMLSIAYLTMKYEKLLVSTGGNKKGFLKAQKKLTDDAITALKTAWNNLYKGNSENMIILNDGIEFQEASSTAVENQMNENKRTNSNEICKLFSVPSGIWEGNVTDDEYANYIKICIMPIVKSLITALNRDMLLESEKDTYYFDIDMRDLQKGNMLQRFQAYDLALKNGSMQWDEIRYLENLEPYGLPFIKMGLADVLFNVKTKEIYTPNTGKTVTLEGGE